LTGPVFKGLTGLILAKITKRGDYESLMSVYEDHYRSFSNGFYLQTFENLVKYLSTNIVGAVK
jgi:hypothetical protein